MCLISSESDRIDEVSNRMKKIINKLNCLTNSPGHEVISGFSKNNAWVGVREKKSLTKV